MSIKLITLNIEGDKHLDKVVPFLRRGDADVVCLQEVFASDFEEIKKKLGVDGYFCQMGNIDNSVYQSKFKKNGPFGICLMTKLDYSKPVAFYYSGDGTCPVLTQSGMSNRALLYSTFQKEGIFYIGTIHFTWTPDGEASQRQRESFDKLGKMLRRIKDFVLCGDFNAPRGGEIFNAFLSSGFTDNLPPEVKSTLDPIYHVAKNLERAVDTIFSKGKYSVENVMVIQGVSDHKALIGEVSVKH